jgi:hypothetical protein
LKNSSIAASEAFGDQTRLYFKAKSWGNVGIEAGLSPYADGHTPFSTGWGVTGTASGSNAVPGASLREDATDEGVFGRRVALAITGESFLEHPFQGGVFLPKRRVGPQSVPEA